MRKRLLLVKYNKVTNDAFAKFASLKHNYDLIFTDLNDFGCRLDKLSYMEIRQLLNSYKPFHAIMVGDIFWPTGQNICRWGKNNNIPVFFLQHGQWIYVKNKKSPRYLPTGTFVYGDNVEKMMSSWEYYEKSKVYVTGNPRYDNIPLACDHDAYVYFSPPVVFEHVPSAADKINSASLKDIESLRGMDQLFKLVIHPHYREFNIDHLREAFPSATFVESSLDPLPIIQKSCCVLTQRNSTVVLDSIACGKKVVLMNFLKLDRSYYKRYYFGEFALESRNVGDCVINLEKCFKNPGCIKNTHDYHMEARKYIYLGNASARLSSIIESHIYKENN